MKDRSIQDANCTQGLLLGRFATQKRMIRCRRMLHHNLIRGSLSHRPAPAAPLPDSLQAEGKNAFDNQIGGNNGVK